MGAFFTNIALKTEEQDKVKNSLQLGGHTIYLSPPNNGWMVVYDKKMEEDVDHGNDLCESLSREFHTTAFFFQVEDSDFFLYGLYFNGKFYDAYISDREKFYEQFAKKGRIGAQNREEFLEYFKGKPKVVVELAVKKKGLLLFRSNAGLEKKIQEIFEKKYTFSEDRAISLAKVLGIKYADHGYYYLSDEGKDLLGEEFQRFLHIKGKE